MILIVFIFLDSSNYAQFLFNAFDKDKNGSLSFEVSIFNLISLNTISLLIMLFITWMSSNILQQIMF